MIRSVNAFAAPHLSLVVPRVVYLDGNSEKTVHNIPASKAWRSKMSIPEAFSISAFCCSRWYFSSQPQNGNQAAGGFWQICPGILRPLALPSWHLCKKACSHCLMTWDRSAKVSKIKYVSISDVPSFNFSLFLAFFIFRFHGSLCWHSTRRRFGAEKCHASLPWCPPHNRRSPYIPSKSWRRFRAMERCKVDLRGN